MDKAISTFDPLEAVTVREAAAMLHLSRPTLEKFIKGGELPSVLIGRCRRIRRVDLSDFIERRTAYGWQRYQPDRHCPVDTLTEGPDGGEVVPF